MRRIHFAPPAAEELTRGGASAASSGTARASVLFANGTFGIWELDARSDLKPVRGRCPAWDLKFRNCETWNLLSVLYFAYLRPLRVSSTACSWLHTPHPTFPAESHFCLVSL